MAKWNKAQQAVLDSLSENKNILVSAAAGSGKTAVLVERILRSIREGLCSVDEILVVTFTRAAAAEMKTRILAGLTQMLEEDPSPRMVREAALADKADMMTIDSFCNRVVRENFHLAEVDPSYQLFDQEEAELIKEDVLEDVMDAYYREDPVFCDMADFFLTGHISDDKLRETIFGITEFAESFADPEVWLSQVREGKGLSALEERVFLDARTGAGELLTQVEKAIALLGPDLAADRKKTAGKLLDLLEDDRTRLAAAADAADLDAFSKALAGKWKSFPRKAVSEDYEEERADFLDRLHTGIKELAKLPDPEELRQEQADTEPLVRKLLEVTEAYRTALLREKHRERRYEFQDINHFAWQVLSRHGEVAGRYREKYKYIYIDEYQDSNDLQENILGLCARRNGKGEPCNIFMVGDVKQSIYRFRLARPELFMEKEERYSSDPAAGKLLWLNCNYRSREEVLDSANVVFRHVMSRLFGGILYDDAASLHRPEEAAYRDHYPLAEGNPVGGKTELFLLTEPEKKEGEKEEYLSGDQGEAYLLAREIRRMVAEKKQYVRNEAYDPEDPASPAYRPAEYRDIVVLMRSVRGTGDLVEICTGMGVPVRVEDRQGYFDAEEVVIMLSLLAVLDNRRQDIPLASALLSPVFRFREEELALVMTEEREKKPLSEKCASFARRFLESLDKQYKKVAEHLADSLGKIARWEEEKQWLSIAELLDRIWEDTNFDRYAAAMPRGGRRLANLKRLQLRAEQFEGKGRKSLFDFLRYIEKCRIHDIDFGEAREETGGGNVVRVMTMHSSKGLEFPIVFLLRLGRGFVTRERSDNVSMSRTFGLGMHLFRKVGDGIRIREKSHLKEEIHQLEREEMLAEESRLLYVAMTRAKEKLVMMGKAPAGNRFPPFLSPLDMKKARNMLDFIVPVLRKDPAACRLIREKDVALPELTREWEKERDARKAGKGSSARELFRELERALEKRGERETAYDFRYGFMEEVGMRSKLSVSEVKHAAMPPLDGHMPEEDVTDQVDVEKMDVIPSGGALRGTVIHRIMELLPFTEVTENDKMKTVVENILAGDSFSEEERNLPALLDVTRFYSGEESSLFQRMRRAEERGSLHREEQFTAGLPAGMLPALGAETEEKVVLQGVIDAWFSEKGEDGSERIILVDYKTDRVKTPRELADRYKAQLVVYKLVMEEITHLPVTEMILFSTIFGEVPIML